MLEYIKKSMQRVWKAPDEKDTRSKRQGSC